MSPLPKHCDIKQRGYTLTLNMPFLMIDGTLQWIGTYMEQFERKEKSVVLCACCRDNPYNYI
jgi:hypothetical protein